MIKLHCERCSPRRSGEHVEMDASELALVCPPCDSPFLVGSCPRCGEWMRLALGDGGGDGAVELVDQLRGAGVEDAPSLDEDDADEFSAQLREVEGAALRAEFLRLHVELLQSGWVEPGAR